jgi:hypothetical protein
MATGGQLRVARDVDELRATCAAIIAELGGLPVARDGAARRHR